MPQMNKKLKLLVGVVIQSEIENINNGNGESEGFSYVIYYADRLRLVLKLFSFSHPLATHPKILSPF